MLGVLIPLLLAALSYSMYQYQKEQSYDGENKPYHNLIICAVCLLVAVLVYIH